MPPLESLERAGDALAFDAPSEPRRMLVIVNPYATTVSDRLRSLVIHALQGRFRVDAIDTEGRDLFRRWVEAAGCTVTVD